MGFSELGLGLLVGFIWMVFGWGVYAISRKSAIVDLFWAICVLLISYFYFFMQEDPPFTASLVLFLVSIWSIKLALLLAYRLFRDKKDGRYERLDATWQERALLKYFFFFSLQAFAAWILTISVFFAVQGEKGGFWGPFFAFALSFIGLLGEGIADFQLQYFLSKKGNRKKVCDQGLWRYSRHPNYFFEWVFWLGIFGFALNTPLGFLSVISPLALLATLLFFSGIPPAEEQAIESKGRSYRKYQEKTSAFIPWRVKK